MYMYNCTYNVHNCNSNYWSVIVNRYVYPVKVGILCLDLHPEHPSLVAVGQYDG